jgi:hypothetical protein
MSNVYRVANDAGAPPVAVTLRQDSVAVDLTGETIDCYLSNAAGAIIEITGMSGTSGGVVSTPLSAANLVAGRWAMEWEVRNGATYPADKTQRPNLIVRPEVS